jgi:beta-aspartyl-peptidase (threonine type)
LQAVRQAQPAVAIHAGAGALDAELREREPDVRGALLRALAAARTLLERGERAEAAAVAAVQAMEDFGLFNAGYGSVLCADGSVQMSAAVMRGHDRAAGAVAALRRTVHPILGAREVLDSPQALLVGADAERWLSARGLEQQPNEAFITERQRRRLQAQLGREPTGAAGDCGGIGGERRAAHTSAGVAGSGDGDRGTVGAVCLDTAGRLAAATSTGGISGQPPGRVGDSPLIGAGTWADRRVAVSCTGDGEAFIRAGAARLLAARVECGASLREASERTLAEVSALGGAGGLIALDAAGNHALVFGTAAMPRAVWISGGEPAVFIAA